MACFASHITSYIRLVCNKKTISIWVIHLLKFRNTSSFCLWPLACLRAMSDGIFNGILKDSDRFPEILTDVVMDLCSDVLRHHSNVILTEFSSENIKKFWKTFFYLGLKEGKIQSYLNIPTKKSIGILSEKLFFYSDGILHRHFSYKSHSKLHFSLLLHKNAR